MIIKTKNEIVNLSDDNIFLAEELKSGDKITGKFIKGVLDRNVFIVNYQYNEIVKLVFYNLKEKKYVGSIFEATKNYGKILD